MEQQLFTRALKIIALAAGIVLLFPVLYPKVPFFQNHFRTYDFFGRFFLAPSDTAAREAVSATERKDTGAPAPPKYSGREHLHRFYSSLNTGRQQVRIGHFGDSSIEGDLITGSFRDSLQRRFGGAGIGFAPVINPISGFRRSLRHNFSDNWYHCSLGEDNLQQLPRGISGEYFTTWIPPDTSTAENTTDSLAVDSLSVETNAADSLSAVADNQPHWVFYGQTKLFPGTGTFPGVRLFYGAPAADSSGIRPAPGRLTTGTGQDILLDGQQQVNVLALSSSPRRRINVTFSLPPTQPIYGFSFESQEGVIVDNFPSRGNTGAALRQINRRTLEAFQQEMDYDLIMLQFGLNVLNPEMTDYSWYQQEMERVIRHFKQAMPDADVLVLGLSDRAIKMDGRMQTDPSVPRITEALRAAAEATGSAFFSFYEAMGGDGSMVEWVENRQPKQANLDYTHFNFTGARAAAMLLLDFLLEGYDEAFPEEASGQPAKENS